VEQDQHRRQTERDRLYIEFAESVRAFRRSVALYQAGLNARHVRDFRAAAGAYNEIVSAQRALRDFQTGPSQARAGNAQARKPDALTPRQMEIARLIARGYTNQRIADALVLTPGTVANHVQHILDRLGLHSRTQVAVWFSRLAGRSSDTNDAPRLQLEPRQTTRRDEFARDAKVQAIVQSVGNQLRQRRIAPRLSVD
jgi:DNA-binding CsgD family transcriptional regulator